MPVFGGRLSDARKGPNKVPVFLEKAFNYLETNGLTSEGLFRISGSLESVKKLQATIEQSMLTTPPVILTHSISSWRL